MTENSEYDVEHSKSCITRANLSFLPFEGDLTGGDVVSMSEFSEASEGGGGVREPPTCQELAIEGECLTKQGDHKEAIPLLESALAMGTSDLQLLSVLWSLLGNAHFYLGNYELAAVCHSHDLAVCRELGDELNQAQAYCNLGIAHRKVGYLQRARLCYERYLQLCDKVEDLRSKCKAHHNLGDLHLTLARLKLQRDKLDDTPEAKEHLLLAAQYFENHLQFTRELENRSAECKAHGNLGLVYELLKNTDKAIDHYEQKLKLAVELANKGSEGRSYCCIGNCLKATIQPEKALECYSRGLNIATEQSDKVGQGTLHCNMGMTCEMLCRMEDALEHHKKHLEATKELENPYGQAIALSNIARAYEYTNNFNKASEAMEQLVKLHQNLKQEGEMLSDLARISRLNELRGDSKPTSRGGKVTWKKLLRDKHKKQRSNTAPVARVSGPGRGTGEGVFVYEDVSKEAEDSSPHGSSSRDKPPDSLSSTEEAKCDSGQSERTDQLELSQSLSAEECHNTTSQPCVSPTPSSQIRSQAFSQNHPSIYKDFGDETHKEQMQHVQEFLESAEESEPVDLEVLGLQDWDGWMMAAKDLIIPSNRESQLI